MTAMSGLSETPKRVRCCDGPPLPPATPSYTFLCVLRIWRSQLCTEGHGGLGRNITNT
ncbi:hypothetical protein HYDPIDRAFT_117452 [Hydnomerulius pinastri MD-312]|uniref:Uncharacterized protein n=1 Tax=Hydnomerulius pinastri MD-312 TaxID=994086 RepID=A0A0C9WAL6_9AGAM|nr:hypothetical protein HYDPIDRAFT_117452 [Hydnomerulius pinastri MD-312]